MIKGLGLIKKAMIMAAGVGSRLDPITKDIPKPLVPVLNKPVMDILLEKLKKQGSSVPFSRRRTMQVVNFATV